MLSGILRFALHTNKHVFPFCAGSAARGFKVNAVLCCELCNVIKGYQFMCLHLSGIDFDNVFVSKNLNCFCCFKIAEISQMEYVFKRYNRCYLQL